MKLAQKLHPDTVLSNMNEETKQSYRLDARVCHCGTVKEAIDTAVKAVITELGGNDCMVWHDTVNSIALQLHGNILAAIRTAEGVPIEDIAREAEFRTAELRHSGVAIFACNAAYIGAKIDGPIREAYIARGERRS